MDFPASSSSKEFHFIPSCDGQFHAPQVANQKCQDTANYSFHLVWRVPSFTLFPGKEQSQVRPGRDSMASAVVTSQNTPCGPPLWLLTETMGNNVDRNKLTEPPLPTLATVIEFHALLVVWS